MKIISRPNYVEHVLRFLDKGLMIALTGQRRVGKSYVLREVAEFIGENKPDANFIYINKEKKKFEYFRY